MLFAAVLMDKAIGEFCTLASAMSTDPRSVALTPVEVVVCWESWLFILLVLKEEESYISKPSKFALKHDM